MLLVMTMVACSTLAKCPGAGCALDPCVGDTDTSAAVECCTQAHGRGLDAEATGVLEADCNGDECNPDQYLSGESALCAAQAHGLESGVGECFQSFGRQQSGEFFWSVRNITDRTCRGDDVISSSGEMLYVDALTGAFIARGFHTD